MSPAVIVIPNFVLLLFATIRIRLLYVSATTSSPQLSIASPPGALSSALIAGPLSPENPRVPVPARTVSEPEVFANARIIPFPVSTECIKPVASKPDPVGICEIPNDNDPPGPPDTVAVLQALRAAALIVARITAIVPRRLL